MSTVSNYEYKLLQAGIQNPAAKYIADPTSAGELPDVKYKVDSISGIIRLQTLLSTADLLGGTPVTRPPTLPTNFATYTNFDIWRDGSGRVQNNFDRKSWCPTPDVQPWITQNTYYVDGIGGVDSNTGLSWALAKKSISAAITSGNTAAIPYVVYVRAGTYNRNGSALCWSSTTPSQPCSFIAVGGRVVSSVSDILTWTLNIGTTYQVSRSNATRVYDIINKTIFNDFNEVTKVTALATCQATPGTWYTDGTILYVNRIDGSVVSDSNTRVFLTSVGGALGTTSGNMYVNGFDFEGGNQYAMRPTNNNSGISVFENCSFKYVTDAGYNGFSALGTAATALINCIASQNPADGFNSHILSVMPFMLTINCIGRSNGKTGSTSNNGLTTHDGGSALDINGTYHNNYGGNVAIVNASTTLWCIGTRAFDSYGDLGFGGNVPSSDFLTDQTNPTLWLDGCVSHGSVYGIYKPAGTVNVRAGYIAQGLNGATIY